MYPRVAFVDSPSTTAAIRFDCNDESGASPRRVASFDPGVPTLEGDPDSVGQVFGFRSPSLTVQMRGAKGDALAALSALAREQLRPTNWLLFQLTATSQPMFLRLYRSQFTPLSLDGVYVNTASGGTSRLPDLWQVDVPLVADAFGYGVRETIPTFQVVQAPADLTGPTRYAMRHVLPTIKGDAPTPLRVTVTPTDKSYANVEWLVGLVAGKTTLADPVVDIGTGDGFTAGTNTAAGTANTNFFGGSQRVVSIAADDSGAGNNNSVRLSGDLPVVPPGRYKVALKGEFDAPIATAKDFVVAFGQDLGTAAFRDPVGNVYFQSRIQYGDSTVVNVGGPTLGAVTYAGWVDLGDFTFPFSTAPAADVTATVPAPAFALRIGLADNSAGTVRLDALKLIPVDGPTVTVEKHLRAQFTNNPLQQLVEGTFDGETETYWATDSDGVFYNSTPGLGGGFPAADPAADQNVLLVMATSRGTGSGLSPYINDLNSQAAVDVSYHPRYLYLGDGT